VEDACRPYVSLHRDEKYLRIWQVKFDIIPGNQEALVKSKFGILRQPSKLFYVSFIFAALMILVNPRPGWAQASAAISGTVEDASGGMVNGATITVKSLETGAVRTATTNAAGAFSVVALPLGPQEVKAEKQGFKAEMRTGINLQVGQDAVVNFQLQIGDVVQQVTVSGEAPVVNTTTSTVSGMVGEQEVKDLPLNGRSFDNLITLNPGTINFALKSAQTSTSNGNTFSVAGRRPAENLILMNGIEYTGSSQLAITPGGVSGELLGIDAVRELNVLTDTYDAEYGKRSGAQVDVVTQSGTNLLHGTVFEFLRNSALDARNYFSTGPTAPPFEQNQFGGALGGPIEKDKWFLFGNYEGFRQALTQSSVSFVPDANARMGILPNPTATPTIGAPKQVVPSTAPILQYMSYWPQPTTELYLPSGYPSGVAVSDNRPKQYIREDFGTLRSDYNLGKGDVLSGAYTIDDGYSLVPLADPLFASASTLRMQVFSLRETHIFSPNALNVARIGFSRAGYALDSVPLATFSPSLDFVTGTSPGGIVIGGGVSTTSGTSTITSAGPNNAAGVFNHRNLFTYADDVKISKGIHQIGFGVWFQRIQDNENAASRTLGQASFTSLTTFLQGTTSSFQVVPTATELGWRSFLGAWYVEDAIKVKRNLTVRVGLRHEFNTGWNEAQGRAANYDLNSSGILMTNPVIGNSVYTQNNAKLLFSPRVGLAWDVFGSGKTAVRAGFGTYYSQIDDLAFLLNSLPPTNGSLTFAGALSSIIPITPGVPDPPSCSPTVTTGCAIYAPQGVQANAKTPTVEEWNLGVEQQLNKSTALRVTYVGSHGYHGFVSVDENAIPSQICAVAAGCLAGGIGTTSTVAQGTEYIPGGTGTTRPNPNLGAGFFWLTQGNSSYNALETEVSHRMGQGLEFRANYTWSKNLDMNSALTGAQASNQPQMILDRNDLRRDWGRSALDAKNQLSISARYELPFGPGKRWLQSAGGVENKLIGGWQLNGISTFLSGFPLTPLVGSNRSGDGDTRIPDRPNLNPSFSGPVILGKPTEWFNPNAFSLPAFGTFGNVGRGSLTGPGLAGVDLSLVKDTVVSERLTVQFRTEIFNAFNRVNFGVPNTTVFSSGVPSVTAGAITTLATNPRQIQFGLKLIF
jgi:hypothetical protein